MTSVDRRDFLALIGALAGAGALTGDAAAQGAPELAYGPAEGFSYEGLRARARELATRAYVAPASPSREILEKIDYDAHGKIRFKTDYALFADGPGRFPATFFHLGRYFTKPVRMHAVADGKAREILYRESYFDMPADSPARQLPQGAGFAGFRFQEARDGAKDWRKNDWVAFLGASYFRAIGADYQYGLSARGLAIDVARPTPPFQEEFPDFTHVWLEARADEPDAVRAYALLDSPSVVGAYAFVMRRGKGVVIDVDCEIHLRRPVARFGVAPLTSMYWYSETAKQTAIDWRPEVHDSDGLALWTGTGERIWRPLHNPTRTGVSAFADENPRGFGLIQRDREFDHYLDGVNYERRPSVWVEPKSGWGAGAVELVEIPTDDEIHDNIGAFWVPKAPTAAGQVHAFSYRLHWLSDEPYPSPLARVVATRLGNGGQPGTARPKGVRKFMIEFAGGDLGTVPYGVKPEVVLSASRGSFSYILVEPMPGERFGVWRAQFDLTAEGGDPIEMRAFLKLGDKVMSETWLYQYHPFA